MSFYPEVGSQYWLSLRSLPECSGVHPPSLENFVRMEPHFGIHSDWWRSPKANFQMGLAPFVARYAVDPHSQAAAQTLLGQFPQHGCTNSCTDFVPDLISDAVFFDQLQHYAKTGGWRFRQSQSVCYTL